MKSKYQIVLDDITTLIENNAYPPGSMLPTEMELAARYGVSRSTIQKTLGALVLKGMITRTAGKGTFVTEHPPQESGLPGCGEVVILLPNHQAQVSFGYLLGAGTRLKQEGIELTAQYSHNSQAQVFQRAKQYAHSGAAGLIVYPITSEDPEGVLAQCAKRGLSVVTIDKSAFGTLLSSVGSNNHMGGYLAGLHLIEKGHRELLWVQNQQDSDTLQDRLDGFVAALAEHGIALPERNRFAFDASEDHPSKEAVKAFLSRRIHSLPTAVFCASDMVASFVYRAAYDLDIKIPDMLSVVGFDNLDIAEAMSPPMTTVAQDFYAIGEEAANLLLEQMRGRGSVVTKRYLPVHLVERESVRDLPAVRLAEAQPALADG